MDEETGQVALSVRLPAELGAWLKTCAAQSLRSVNSQLVWLLQRARQQEAPDARTPS